MKRLALILLLPLGATAATVSNTYVNATREWVTNQAYVTKTVTNGLASVGFVTNQGYVTMVVTNGLASTNWVQAQGYSTNITAGVTNILAGSNITVTSTSTGLLISTDSIVSFPIATAGRFSVDHAGVWNNGGLNTIGGGYMVDTGGVTTLEWTTRALRGGTWSGTVSNSVLASTATYTTTANTASNLARGVTGTFTNAIFIIINGVITNAVSTP